VARWQETLTGIAIEEMLHLALVNNVMTAIGAAPTLARPNFPRHSEFLPPGAEFALLPFGADSLTHFLYLERPEGMERVDAMEFVPAAPPPEPAGQAEVMPRVQGFLTAGHLYRGIEQGLSDLASRLGEPVLFVGEPRAQATPDRFRWPQLIAVTDLASARAAIDEIIEQGEGARGDWRPAHYGRFFAIWSEYQKLREQDPSFEPARPVIPAFTQQPYDIEEPQPQPTEPLTRRVAELFNLGYEVLLQVLTRFFTHTDETDEQLDALVHAALGIMAGVLKPLGTALTRLPMGPGNPGCTAVRRSRCTTRWGTSYRGEMPPGCCCPNGRPYCPGSARDAPRGTGFPRRSARQPRPPRRSRNSSPGTCRKICGPPRTSWSRIPPAEERLGVHREHAVGVAGARPLVVM